MMKAVDKLWISVLAIPLLVANLWAGASYNGGSASSGVGVSTGIMKVLAGTGISLSPTTGIGEVTVTNTVGAVGSAGNNIQSSTQAWIDGGQTVSFQINTDTKAYINTSGNFILSKSSLQVVNTVTSTSGFFGPHSGSGAGLTALTASAISAGSLGASVMGSSLAANSVNSAQITDGTIGSADVQSSVFLSSSASGATAGSYTNASITVDVNGIVKAASSGSSSSSGTIFYAGGGISTIAVSGAGISAGAAAGVLTLTVNGGGGGGANFRVFKDSADASVNASTVNFITTNALAVAAHSSSITISIPVDAVMQLLRLTVNGLVVGSSITFTGPPGVVLAVTTQAGMGFTAGISNNTTFYIYTSSIDARSYTVAFASVGSLGTITSTAGFFGPATGLTLGGNVVSTFTVNGTDVLQNKRFDASSNNMLISTYTLGLPGPVYFSSTSVCNTTSTSNGFGEAIFTHNDSTLTNKVLLRKFWVSSNDPSVEVKMHFAEQSTGTVAGNRHYVISMATVAVDNGNYSTIGMVLPIATTVSTAITGPGSTISNLTMTGWSSRIGTGGCWVIIQVGRDGNNGLDTSKNPTMTDASALTLGFIQ